MSYEDLILSIEPSPSGGLRTTLLQPLQGGSSPLVLPLSPARMAPVLASIGRQVRSGLPPSRAPVRPPALGGPAAPEPATPQELGEALFEALFRGAIRDTFMGAWQRVEATEDRYLRLRLVFDPSQGEAVVAAAALPWELLRDPRRGRFLGRDRRLSITRFISPGRTAPLPPARPPLRILIVAAQPRGYPPLAVAQELGQMENAWRQPNVRLSTLEHATAESLHEGVLKTRPHVVHFIGHGTFASTTPRGEPQGAVVLEDGQGGAESLTAEIAADTLRSLPSLRLVLLNACDTARSSAPGAGDPYAGLATALARDGMPAVVAMQFPIADRTALEFSRHLHGALADGLTLDQAVVESRLALAREADGGDSGLEWATPALFLGAEGEELLLLRPGSWKERWLALRGAFGRSPWARRAAIAALTFVAGFAAWAGLAPAPPYRTWLNPRACPSPPEVAMRFLRIEPGTLVMGSEEGEPQDGPPHTARVDEPFCMGVFEVTNRQWSAVMGEVPASASEASSPDADLPVEGISLEEAWEYVRRLASADPVGGLTLPREVEWELAARGGTQSAFSFGESPALLARYGNCLPEEGAPSDGFDGAAPVGSFRPNPWGLYDMHGNVFEWVSDAFRPYPGERGPMPLGDDAGKHVRRGGSHSSAPRRCTSFARSLVLPQRGQEATGLRLIRRLGHRRPDPPRAPQLAR